MSEVRTSLFPEYELSLADGSRWIVASGCAETAALVQQFGRALQLAPPSGGVADRLVVLADGPGSFFPKNGSLTCILPIDDNETMSNLIRISHLIARRGVGGDAAARGPGRTHQLDRGFAAALWSDPGRPRRDGQNHRQRTLVASVALAQRRCHPVNPKR